MIPIDSISHDIRPVHPHRVIFTRDAAHPDNPAIDHALADTRRAAIVIESGVATAHPTLAGRLTTRLGPRLAAPPLILPGGEEAKNTTAVWLELLEAASTHHLDRHSALIAIGGGAFLDVAGFAAATAHRGLRLVRLPTTVLAQADSGVGVKNGLNMFGKKNFTGVFAVPFAVINDFALLSTQPSAEARDGLVEAVKVACIRDAAFFDWLEARSSALAGLAPAPLEEAIRRSATLHFNHICVGGDPFESGSSRPLDFGHWVAHKLESLTHHAVSHARAVAVGMAVDIRYSVLAGHLDPGSADRILAVLATLGLPTHHPDLAAPGPDGQPAILAGLEEFREHLGGELTISLLSAIGQSFDTHHLDPSLVLQCLESGALASPVPGP